MRPDTQSILSSPGLLQANRTGCERLATLFADGELEHVFILAGLQEYTEDADSNWETWLDASLDSLAGKTGQIQAPYVFQPGTEIEDYFIFRPLIINYNPRGVHFVDNLFGAEVFRMGDKSWQAHVLNTPIGELEPVDLDALLAWRDMKQFTEAFLSRDVPGVYLGMPTIASALNIAVNLYGQNILVALLEEPDAARHDLTVINDTLCRIHQWYIEHVPFDQLQCIIPDGRFQPPGSGQICGCTTQLISSDLYRTFIAPLDDAMLSLYANGGMIHLCGCHTQHIPAWKEMKSLRAVQMNDRAAEDLTPFFAGLREDQIMYVNPCQKMPTNRVMSITKGRRLVLCRP